MTLFPTKELKKEINSLRCPLCKCGLEGVPYGFDGIRESLNLKCVFAPNHYQLFIDWYLSKPIINYVSEKLIITDINIGFSIHKHFKENQVIQTTINRYDLNRDGLPPLFPNHKQYIIEGDMLPFQSATKNLILDKIKTIMLFS